MHEFIFGHWLASSYTTKGIRTDHVLFVSPDGAFQWIKHTGAAEEIDKGRWAVDADDNAILLHAHRDGIEQAAHRWGIEFVSGCERSNMILVLRRVALVSPNLPILFTRFHPPDDPVWHQKSSL